MSAHRERETRETHQSRPRQGTTSRRRPLSEASTTEAGCVRERRARWPGSRGGTGSGPATRARGGGRPWKVSPDEREIGEREDREGMVTHLADLAPAHERRGPVLLPPLDRRGVDRDAPEVVQREDAHGDQDGHARHVVEHEDDDLGRRGRGGQGERVERARRDHPEVVRARDVDGDEEAEKVAVVGVPDAVVDPRTCVWGTPCQQRCLRRGRETGMR